MLRRILLLVVSISYVSPMAFAQASTCPLIGRNNYEELFKAVDLLEKDIRKTVEGCDPKSADLRSMLDAQTQLKASTGQLHQYWQDPGLAANDSTAFANHLSQAVGSVQAITNTMGNSTLFKSACGGESPNSGKVLLRINEVLTNMAPIALLAGTLTGGVVQALPYVLGVTAVTSIFNILSSADKDKPNMSNDDHRQLVMRAACEYTRIQQRIRYLTLMQTGKRDELAAELKFRTEQFDKSLAGKPELSKIVQEYRLENNKVDDLWKNINGHREKFRLSFSEFEKIPGDDHELRCSYLKKFANVSKPSDFPLDIANQIQKIEDENQNAMRAALFDSFVSVDTHLKERLPEILNNKIKKDECSALLSKWTKNMGLVLDKAGEALLARKTRMIEKLGREQEYSKWSKEIEEVEGLKVLLEKVVQFMDVRQEPSDVVNRSELNQRIGKLKVMLFGTNDVNIKYNPWATKSQVAAWLEHQTKLYKNQIKVFNESYHNLTIDSYNTFRSMNIKLKNDEVTQKYGFEKLSLLRPEYYQDSAKRNGPICSSLENVANNWGIAQAYLETVGLFCKVIAESIRNHPDLDPEIVSMCAGKIRLDGKYAEEPGWFKLKRTQDEASTGAIYASKMNNALFAESSSDKYKTVEAKRRDFYCTVSSPK